MKYIITWPHLAATSHVSASSLFELPKNQYYFSAGTDFIVNQCHGVPSGLSQGVIKSNTSRSQ